MIEHRKAPLRILPANREWRTEIVMTNTQDPAPILMASDDTALAATLGDVLDGETVRAIATGNPAAIIQEAGAVNTRAVLLDSRYLGESAAQLCRRFRRGRLTAAIPIIVITAPEDVNTRIQAFENGADDCVSAPGDIGELSARIRAKLGRTIEPPEGRLHAGPIEIDLDRWTASVSGNPVSLTKKEFLLLQALIESRGRTLSREFLLHKVWALNSNVETRTIDVHVARLRRKLGPSGRHILTVRNVGFRLDLMPDWITGRSSPGPN